MSLPVAVAAGHAATADAGLEILADGGTAADAAVAATLASCVAETIMTGFLGGGHAIWWDATSGEAELCDFFVGVPGLDGGTASEMIDVPINFGTVPVPYRIGAASVGVPGVPAGCHALWERGGRLPWPRLVEPARRLAATGVALSPTHADCLVMLAPAMTLNEGKRIYCRDGELLRTGEAPTQPGLANLMELVRDEGALTCYRGTLAETLVDTLSARGSVLGHADLRAYEARWTEPHDTTWGGVKVRTRRGLCTLLDVLERLPAGHCPDPAQRARGLVAALGGDGPGHTTNLVTTDADGNACVVTTSLGLGSADWLPGLDAHCNSMLGEVDLQRGDLEPGDRMGSMMAPTLVTDGEGLALVAGAAGGTRIAGALAQVLSTVIVDGQAPGDAVQAPRLHPVAGVVHAEPGYDESALAALQADGWEVVRWQGRHHYFGGVGLICATGAAGDPRRDGAARVLEGL